MWFVLSLFFRFRNTRNRYFVHANLALSLALAESLFLFGISRTGHKVKIFIIWVGSGAMTRSEQQPSFPVTAFSQTDLFLD